MACLYREAQGAGWGVGAVLGLGQAPQVFLFPLPVWEGEASRGESRGFSTSFEKHFISIYNTQKHLGTRLS